MTDLEEQRRRRRKKQASRDRAPGVQFTHARAPSIHPPTQMSQQRPNELKYLYSLPIQTPRAPELPRSSSRSNSNNGKNRRRRPRSERASRTRTSQIQRDRDRSRGRSARAAPSPPPPARTLPAEHSPAPRGEQPPRRSRTTPNRLHRHPRQSDAATQADMYDSDSGSEPGNRLQQESTRVDSVQHFTSSSVHHTNGSPHVDDRRGSAKSGVLDRAQTHELPDFHNPQKQGSTPSPGSRAVMPQAGVNPEGSTLSSQLALQMILQTLTQGATGAPTVSGKNNVASPGLDMNNYNLDGILRNRVASVTHAPAAMHVEGAPVGFGFHAQTILNCCYSSRQRPSSNVEIFVGRLTEIFTVQALFLGRTTMVHAARNMDPAQSTYRLSPRTFPPVDQIEIGTVAYLQLPRATPASRELRSMYQSQPQQFTEVAWRPGLTIRRDQRSCLCSFALKAFAARPLARLNPQFRRMS